MCRSNRGFTLIEFLVAIVILMVGMLGLLQTVNVALNHNLQNQFRNEATVIADRWMATQVHKPFEYISTATVAGIEVDNVEKKIQNEIKLKSYSSGFTLKNYSVIGTTKKYSNSKEISYRITWRYKGNKVEHGVTSVVSKTSQ